MTTSPGPSSTARAASASADEESFREIACPLRWSGRCADVSNRLGWDHGLPLTDCNRCHESGGFGSPGGDAVRTTIVNLTISAFREPGRLARLPSSVRAAMARHIPDLGPVVATLPEHPRDAWQRVEFSWENAARLIRSLSSGTVTRDVFETRLASCKGCTQLRRDEEGKMYCGACGCGKNPLARLDRKLWFSHLECPLGKPGFSIVQPG